MHGRVRRKSIIPKGLWYPSPVGSALLLSYAPWREDPVGIILSWQSHSGR
ncbi:MAG: lipid-A-disaccharide synthase N-terminal domain-containing protein [Candidatus Accumulibacter sp. UW26]